MNYETNAEKAMKRSLESGSAKTWTTNIDQVFSCRGRPKVGDLLTVKKKGSRGDWRHFGNFVIKKIDYAKLHLELEKLGVKREALAEDVLTAATKGVF